MYGNKNRQEALHSSQILGLTGDPTTTNLTSLGVMFNDLVTWALRSMFLFPHLLKNWYHLLCLPFRSDVWNKSDDTREAVL